MRFFKDISISALLLFQVLLLMIPESINGKTETTFPRPSGPVADYAAIIETEAEQMINSIARKLWVEYRFGLVIATLPSDIQKTPEIHVRQIFNEWGIGKNREALSALMVIGPEGKNIYLMGSKRLDAILTVKQLSFITEQFAANVGEDGSKMSEALLLSVNALKNIVSNTDKPAIKLDDNNSTIAKGQLVILFLAIILLLAVLTVLFNSVGVKAGGFFKESSWFGGSIENREFGGGIKNR